MKGINKSQLTRLINKAKKLNININELTKGKDIDKIKGNALTSFVKKLKRSIELPKIKEENKKYDLKFQEKQKTKKANDEIKQNIKNDKFLKKHPEFKAVFMYDNPKKIKDAEAVAKDFMNDQYNDLYNTIVKAFPNASEKMKKELYKEISRSGYSVKALDTIRTIMTNLHYAQGSDAKDVPLDELEILDDYTFDDLMLNRIIVRAKRRNFRNYM